VACQEGLSSIELVNPGACLEKMKIQVRTRTIFELPNFRRQIRYVEVFLVVKLSKIRRFGENASDYYLVST
jgi:hypothetical protein